MAVSKDDVIRVANELVAAGITPSMKAVRDRLGKGSFTTISPLLREWRELKDHRAKVAIEMPSEAKAIFEKANIDTWAIVSQLAAERLEKIQADADEAVKVATIERDEAMSEINRLESQIEKLNARIDEIELAAKADRDAAEALRQKLLASEYREQTVSERLTATLAERDEARQEARQSREELARLEGRFEAQQEQFKAIMGRLGPVTDN